MKVGIIGSGTVAQAVGDGFIKRGDEVMLSSRSPEKLDEWVENAGDKASAGTMEKAAKFGELLVTAVSGTSVEEAIESAGPGSFDGKVVIDVTNPLDHEGDGLPSLAYRGDDSGGERIQKAAPDAKVVKTLNIVNSGQMVDPEIPGEPTMFVAGEDEAAKQAVTGILEDFGWKDVVDIGGIDASREMESLCILWCRYAIPNQAWDAGFALLRQ
jgi:predicted dinucleotide-binding enzyme